ncbi:hypothetical protein KUTeg_003781 [Tegillarca granosa]|uniref:SEC7 domain-containing protein n=1 Tax=Tegillarca granosa TaxID=220873 RepID=A0ABQ9FSK3_TEGGR|nr:hypothetical protein KUTeg_003781 [Tegillarca granosa]
MEAMDVSEDSKNNPKTKQMSIGKKKFNMDPKKGIEYLVENDLLPNTPEEVAKFLYQGEGLNKTAIGDYLGEKLPGEAQKIDRMMECFAERYCELNTGVFTSTDTCYVLSFAIIMLNTSLHNPSVKDKPTSLYDSIKKEPFKIPEDDGNDLMHTFFNPDKEGWLWKQDLEINKYIVLVAQNLTSNFDAIEEKCLLVKNKIVVSFKTVFNLANEICQHTT